MNEWLQVFALAAVIYGMKALPLYWRFVPRTALSDLVLDLMPAGLMTALLFPTALLGAVQQEMVPGALVLASVGVSIWISYRTNKPAFGIGAGLAVLAIAELI
jgi:branched-subunit amino acid transport protein